MKNNKQTCWLQGLQEPYLHINQKENNLKKTYEFHM